MIHLQALCAAVVLVEKILLLLRTMTGLL